MSNGDRTGRGNISGSGNRTSGGGSRGGNVTGGGRNSGNRYRESAQRQRPPTRRVPSSRREPLPRRDYTPEERRIIEERRRDAMERQRRTTNVALGVLVVIVVMIAGACIWYFGFIAPNDNYDAQMRIGMQNFKEKQYAAAAEAFQKALEKKPHDPDATIALSDTYAAEKKYEEAIRELKALLGLDDTDPRIHERLVTLYVKGKQDIGSANEVILAAYKKNIKLENELINPPPTFDPAPGDYDETTKIAIKTLQGLTVYYSTDESIPTPNDGQRYEKKISLPNNTSATFTAVAYAPNGLMGWPSTAKYSLTIKYSVDTAAMKHFGDTAEEIMDDVGPLYYETNNSRGYYYKDDNGSFYYVFDKDHFITETTSTDGAVTSVALDPNRDPLPPDAVCVAISMKISEYIVQLRGDIKVEDFMTGIDVKKYKVKDDDNGVSHLTYTKDGVSYDLELKNETTITGNMTLIAKEL